MLKPGELHARGDSKKTDIKLKGRHNVSMDKNLEKWLSDFNERCDEKDIPFKGRPIIAMLEYNQKNSSKTHDLFCSGIFNSDVAIEINTWFEKHSRPGSLDIGVLFKSLYFYNNQLWPLNIPVIYGQLEIKSFYLQCIEDLPDVYQKKLESDQNLFEKYTRYFLDCYDYSYGMEDIQIRGIKDFGHDLLFSAHKNLGQAATLFLEISPNKSGIIQLTLALEIFIKSCLVLKKGYDEKKIKSYGHKLNLLWGELISIKDFAHLKGITPQIDKLPHIGPSKYEASQFEELTTKELWGFYQAVQCIAATILRDLSGRSSLI